MAKQSIPILTKTVRLTGTVAAHRGVTMAGAQAGADGNTYGCSRIAGVSGELIPVDIEGTTVWEAGAAITAGASLETDASGRVVTWATSGPRVGIALEAAGAAGVFIEVRLLQNAA